MLKLLKPKTGERIRENIEDQFNSNNDPTVIRNKVTEVLTDSANQPKRPKIKSQSQPASKERPAVARTLFVSEKNHITLPMPKALTASLPTFDRKSEKFEFFKNLFRNNIKMYPHL